MVKLFVKDLGQVTILEYLLATHGVEYDVELDDGRWGIDPPYLTVYGAPLDERRSIRWIRSQQEGCYCE